MEMAGSGNRCAAALESTEAAGELQAGGQAPGSSLDLPHGAQPQNFFSLGWRDMLRVSVWHGGSWCDAWLNAVAAQVRLSSSLR